MNQDIYIKNKKAYFEYQVLDKYIAGIQLLGTEIKSIRQGKANINDAFCTFIGSQLYVRNLHISEYSFGSFYNHEAKRDRILLLNKKELKKAANPQRRKRVNHCSACPIRRRTGLRQTGDRPGTRQKDL